MKTNKMSFYILLPLSLLIIFFNVNAQRIMQIPDISDVINRVNQTVMSLKNECDNKREKWSTNDCMYTKQREQDAKKIAQFLKDDPIAGRSQAIEYWKRVEFLKNTIDPEDKQGDTQEQRMARKRGYWKEYECIAKILFNEFVGREGDLLKFLMFLAYEDSSYEDQYNVLENVASGILSRHEIIKQPMLDNQEDTVLLNQILAVLNKPRLSEKVEAIKLLGLMNQYKGTAKKLENLKPEVKARLERVMSNILKFLKSRKEYSREDAMVYAECLSAISRFGPARLLARDDLIQFTRDSKRKLTEKQMAIDVLNDLASNDPTSMRYIVSALATPDPKFKQYVLNMIPRQNCKEYPFIIDALDSPNPKLRAEAKSYLLSLSRSPSDGDLKPTIKKFAEAQKPENKVIIATLLGQVGFNYTKEIEKVLLDAYKNDPNEEVRKASLKALKKLSGKYTTLEEDSRRLDRILKKEKESEKKDDDDEGLDDG